MHKPIKYVEKVVTVAATGVWAVFQRLNRVAPNQAPIPKWSDKPLAAARLGPGDFDWPGIFGDGVRWFHSGGLFAALSDSTSELILEGMRAARAAGAVVSFDLHYRDKLWRTHGGQERARAVIGRIVENVDVLLGNEEDVQQALGISGPEMRAEGGLDAAGFVSLMGRVRERYPRLAVMATTLRDVRSANRHLWSALASVGGEVMVAPTCELDVYDRVGGGDGFAAGFIYGLLAGETAEQALRLGWAHGALVTGYPGDTTMATLAQVRAVAAGGAARIQR